MQGRRPRPADLAIFVGSIVTLAIVLLWGFRVI